VLRAVIAERLGIQPPRAPCIGRRQTSDDLAREAVSCTARLGGLARQHTAAVFSLGQIAENPLLTDAPSASESFSENEGHAILPSNQPVNT